MKLYLASESPYRRAQLQALGLEPIPLKPKLDEEEKKRWFASHHAKGTPQMLAEFLAREKAESVLSEVKEGVILGGDQLVSLEGEILGKAGSREAACAQLERLSGRWHQLITSTHLILLQGSKRETHWITDITRIKIRRLSRPQFEAYVTLDQSWDCAGSYKIEKAGFALVDSLESQDPSSIQGIPLIGLTSQLMDWGLPLFRTSV